MERESDVRKSFQFSTVHIPPYKQVWLPNLGVWAMLPSAMSNNNKTSKKEDDISLNKNPGASCSKTDEKGDKGFSLQEQTQIHDHIGTRRKFYNFSASDISQGNSIHRQRENFDTPNHELRDFHPVSQSACDLPPQQELSSSAVENSNNLETLGSPCSVPSSSFLTNQNSLAEDVTGTCIENAFTGCEQSPDAAVEKVGSCSLPKFDDPDRNDSGPCPICLTAIAPESKAILKFCLHTFCVGCISRWSKIRRFCPLCKGDFVGWWYNVQSDARYDEQDLPSLFQETGQQGTSEGAPEWALTARGPWRAEWRPQRGPRQQQSRRPEQPPPGPRPYFYRLQRGLRSTDDRVPEQDWSSFRPDRHNAQTAFAGIGSSSGRFRDEHQHAHRGFAQAFERRRRVYEQNLRSLPVESARLHRASQVLAREDVEGEARERRRLEPWIQRELKTGSLRQGPPTQNRPFLLRNIRQVEEQKVTDEGAMRELDKFLGSNASTFWHEFRNFAENPFSMQAYDSVVRYIPFNEQQSSDFPASQEPISFQNINRSDINSSPRIQSPTHIQSSPPNQFSSHTQFSPHIHSSPCIQSSSHIQSCPRIQPLFGRETRNGICGENERQGNMGRSRERSTRIGQSREGNQAQTEDTRIGKTETSTIEKRPWDRNLRMDDEVSRGEREQARDTRNGETETRMGKRRRSKINMGVYSLLEREARNGINGETESKQGTLDRSWERNTRNVEFNEGKQVTRIGRTEKRKEKIPWDRTMDEEISRGEREKKRDSPNGENETGMVKRGFLKRNTRVYKCLERETENGINGEMERQGNRDRSRERNTRIVEFKDGMSLQTEDTRIQRTEKRTTKSTGQKRPWDRNLRMDDDVRGEREQMRDNRNGESEIGMGKRRFLERNLRVYKSLIDEQHHIVEREARNFHF